MIRSAIAVVIGVVTWALAATFFNWALRAGMPGYSAVEPTMAFTLPMLFGRLAVGLVASLAAGVACGAVSRAGRRAGPILAMLMVLMFLPVHYKLWAVFPAWYHLFFLITLAPAILAGVVLQRRLVAGKAT
jgi:hypothetical protein